jgi:Glycosyltransferase family 87
VTTFVIRSGVASLAATRRRILIAGAIALLAGVYIFKISKGLEDFEVYLRAGSRVRAAEQLYRSDDGHYQFKYLPAFAMAMVPFAMLSPPAAKAAWFACSVGLLAGLLILSLRLLPVRRKTTAFLIGATLVLMAKFYGHEIALGQVNLLMAFLVVAAGRLMLTGRERGAGFLMAAAVIVKPYAVLFLPYLVARGKTASIVMVVIGLGLALLAPAALYGFEGNSALLQDWWRTVTGTTAPNLLDRNNVSAASVFTRSLGPSRLAEALAAATVMALIAAAAFVFVRRSRLTFPEGLEIGLLLTIMPIISPQGWDYVFLISTPAVMYLVNYADELPRSMRLGVTIALLVIAFSLYDLMGRRAYAAFMSWSMITACYVIVIAGLMTLRVRRIA